VDEQRPLDVFFSQSTKLIARTLRVERVGIWLLEEGQARLRCVCQYRRSTNQHDAGEVLNLADFPAYRDTLEERRAIVADDARTYPGTRQLARVYLEPNGITSMLDAPILRHGKVAGVVCHEHVGPRRIWTDSERSFAASVADIMALAMEQAAGIEAERASEKFRRRAEEKDRMASLGRVTVAVAHDFGHVLSIALAHAQSIREVPGLDDQTGRHAASILDAIRRGRELTRQLAEIGREPAVPEELGLDRIVGAMAALLRSLPRCGQRIEIELGTGDARVPLDRLCLERVLLNLVGNALDATTEGGAVRITTTRVVHGAGEYAVLGVADDGAGIDQAALPHIFEPYVTTKQRCGGSGLGLAIVHATVQRVGGFVTVDSAAGRGTTFAVYLPVASVAGSSTRSGVAPTTHLPSRGA